jgi:RNA polymerase sigma-70 factor (ECF subfamily)
MTQRTVQRTAGTLADERNLVERAASGDQSAFRAIMERNNQRLYRVARAVMKDDTEAEDVVQETYLRAFFNLSKFRGESSLTTWLTRIALNEALGRKRKQRAMVTLETVETAQQTSAQIIQFPAMNTETDPERSAAQNEIQRLLERAMDALPEPFRLVFVMRDVEEMSIEETASHPRHSTANGQDQIAPGTTAAAAVVGRSAGVDLERNVSICRGALCPHHGGGVEPIK